MKDQKKNRTETKTAELARQKKTFAELRKNIKRNLNPRKRTIGTHPNFQQREKALLAEKNEEIALITAKLKDAEQQLTENKRLTEKSGEILSRQKPTGQASLNSTNKFRRKWTPGSKRNAPL